MSDKISLNTQFIAEYTALRNNPDAEAVEFHQFILRWDELIGIDDVHEFIMKWESASQRFQFNRRRPHRSQ